MALRVLLADESSTIKKVIGLSLQDFAVEVKVVHSGVDVIEVAKQFKPDLIFADVLLQKRNGYDVCFDIKNDPALAQIPVVLMWSSFMDLDEKAFIRSQANAKLEKPFEVDHLRQLVTQLSSRAQTQKASPFLKFPENFSQPLKNEMQAKHEKSGSGVPTPPQNPRQAAVVPPPPPPVQSVQAPQMQAPPPVQSAPVPPPPSAKANSNWNMDSFEDIQIFSDDEDQAGQDLNKSAESFSEMRLTSPGTQTSQTTMTQNFNFSDTNQETWAQKDLANFKIDTSDEADPFALMDLNSVEFTQAAKAPAVSAPPPPPPPSAKAKPPAPAPPKAIEDANEIQSFDFSDEDLSADLSLDETRAVPAEVPAHEAASSWKFQLPEFEKSPVQPGDILELPPESENSEISKLAKGALEGHYAGSKEPPVYASSNMDSALIEKIVREQTRELVEKIVHRILPDMARTLIQTELDRLLSEENP